eukprot:gnl/Dysnectes_brevis/2593_a3130_1778.p1 GENE.gnl/Dysnectes_brevis/2593_a3130_1778~~gnl/Dysnectes_brevis/2593_a3130_1778.p1  ORF type:complete len:420 (-),score=22.21 gnl/Dysnectes_brevis/2593_a3130_1778:52-1311(-)
MQLDTYREALFCVTPAIDSVWLKQSDDQPTDFFLQSIFNFFSESYRFNAHISLTGLDHLSSSPKYLNPRLSALEIFFKDQTHAPIRFIEDKPSNERIHFSESIRHILDAHPTLHEVCASDIIPAQSWMAIEWNILNHDASFVVFYGLSLDPDTPISLAATRPTSPPPIQHQPPPLELLRPHGKLQGHQLVSTVRVPIKDILRAHHALNAPSAPLPAAPVRRTPTPWLRTFPTNATAADREAVLSTEQPSRILDHIQGLPIFSDPLLPRPKGLDTLGSREGLSRRRVTAKATAGVRRGHRRAYSMASVPSVPHAPHGSIRPSWASRPIVPPVPNGMVAAFYVLGQDLASLPTIMTRHQRDSRPGRYNRLGVFGILPRNLPWNHPRIVDPVVQFQNQREQKGLPVHNDFKEWLISFGKRKQ